MWFKRKSGTVYYQSDWAEAGLPTALNDSHSVDLTAHLDDDRSRVQEIRVAGAVFRWVVTPSEFESRLYGFPIWNLRLGIDDADGSVLTARLDSPVLQKLVNDGLIDGKEAYERAINPKQFEQHTVS